MQEVITDALVPMRRLEVYSIGYGDGIIGSGLSFEFTCQLLLPKDKGAN